MVFGFPGVGCWPRKQAYPGVQLCDWRLAGHLGKLLHRGCAILCQVDIPSGRSTKYAVFLINIFVLSCYLLGETSTYYMWFCASFRLTPDQKYFIVVQLNTNQISVLKAPPVGVIGQCQVVSVIQLAEDVKPHLVDLDLKTGADRKSVV